MIGTRVGSYEILDEVGQGGMATVYRAYQATVGRYVALKVLHTSLAGRRSSQARFLREARLIARLEHPHLLPVHDFDATHDPPYLVMRYLAGASLKEILAGEHLPIGESLHLLRQVSRALDYAHRQQVVHRDIKPSNILVDREGNAFLTDFGIARLARSFGREGEKSVTQTGSLVGTPAYMAPEQGLSEAVDHRADLYALGVVLYEMLTGELPFLGDSPLGTILKHVNDPIPDPRELRSELSEPLSAVVTRSLAKRPEDRYQSAVELVQAAEAAHGEPMPSLPGELRSAARRLASAAPDEPAQDPEALPATLDISPRSSGRTRDSTGTPIEAHRQVTVLFANLAECVELIVDDDERARLPTLFERLKETIARHTGLVHHQGADSLLAIWGLETVREDDAEQAIRAALEMAEIVRRQLDEEESSDEPVPMQIGIATGPVLVSMSGTDTHPTTRGTTTSRVKRLERAAPAGAILIEHDTYRHVRGVFSFEPADPLRVRGRRRPLQTYRVKRAKPRAFRRASRGVEGVETRMIGRQVELQLLQEVFWSAIEEDEAQLVTLVGDPGVGKSRLLFELTDWSDLTEVAFWLLQGRATPETRDRPFGLFRDLVAFRFEVRDDDSAETVQQKLESGTAGLLGGEDNASRETAHYLGRLAGFPLADSDLPEGIESDAARFREQALHHLNRLVRGACSRHPMMIQLEDLHWADEPSLDLIIHLLRQASDLPLMVVTSARPGIDARRPRWGGDLPSHTRIDLRPLSRREARSLVREILQRVPEVPAALRDLIVDRAEGNPYYLEELVKVLIEEHVILKGEREWRIEVDRLPEMPVPTTLIGLVQTRLDGLFPAERLALQRAAVIGRVFWDDAVSELQAADGVPLDVAGTLDTLTRRELVRAAEGSAFAGYREFAFPSTLVREVVLDTLPAALRRSYHDVAAQWLQKAAGDRAAEFAAAVADHLEKAGAGERAVPFLLQAGERALALSALKESEAFLRRAQELTAVDSEMSFRLRTRLGEVFLHRGQFGEARRQLEEVLELTRVSELRSAALSRLAQVAVGAGELQEARSLFEESFRLAEERGDPDEQARALYGLGDVAWRRGDLDEAERQLGASLDSACRSGLTYLELYCLNRLGTVTMFRGDHETAIHWFERCRQLAETSGHRDRLAAALGNLGVIQRLDGDLDGATRRFRDSLSLAEEIGDPHMAHVTRLNLGVTLARQGRSHEAGELFLSGLAYAREEHLATLALGALVGTAGLRLESGDERGARALLAVVLAYPELDADVRFEADLVIERLPDREVLPDTLSGSEAEALWRAVDEVLASGRSG